jgi:hypothetical protein
MSSLILYDSLRDLDEPVLAPTKTELGQRVFSMIDLSKHG